MPSRKASRKRTAETARTAVTAEPYWIAVWLRNDKVILGLFAILVLLFYATPLSSEHASIQWDAADVHYSSQKYMSDSLRSGKLPFWQPYVFSGMPFLADPQTGSWYPLNWPFFLLGVTPRAIEWELALHALLACFGVYLLTKDLLGEGAIASLAGVLYGFSGFFAAHGSHVGIFQAAALFPWLLWTFRRAILTDARRYGAAAAIVGACVVLTGHFQTALYCFFGLALFTAAGILISNRAAILRTSALFAAVAGLAFAAAAIQVLPGLELASHSIRSTADYSKQTNGVLVPGALLTLFSANYYGAVTGPYQGPPDVTQFYFYGGILLPLLAIAGLWRGPLRWAGLGLLVPAVWYAFGPPGGLYLLLTQLPGFRQVRAPVHIWFVAALALALLAAAGMHMLQARFRIKWLTGLVLAVSMADLWYWNMDQNVLAYNRTSYEDRYGSYADRFEQLTAPVRDHPLHRMWAPYDSNSFGPMNNALNTHTEVTYGYNPLELLPYADYLGLAGTNAKLLDGLSVTDKVMVQTGQIVPNPSTLARVSVPPTLVRVATPADAKNRLATLDPAREALVGSRLPQLSQDPAAQVQITGYEGDRYQVRYTAATPTLLRIAVPYFPGWRARVDGQPLEVVTVDHALSGVVVPAGKHEMVFAYKPAWFLPAALLSALAWLFLVFGCVRRSA